MTGADGFRLSDPEVREASSHLASRAAAVRDALGSTRRVLEHATGEGGAISDALVSASMDAIAARIGALAESAAAAAEELSVHGADFASAVRAADADGGA